MSTHRWSSTVSSLITLRLMLRGVLDAVEEVDAVRRLQSRIRKAIENGAEVVTPDERLKLEPRQAEHDDFMAAMATAVPHEHISNSPPPGR